MAERLKIGLVYSYNENWIAGAYYILNLIKALDLLDAEQKPFLYIISETPEEFDSVKQTGYPFLQFVQFQDKDLWPSYRFSERILNKISRSISGKDLIYREKTYKRMKLDVDVLFPAPDNVYFSKIPNNLFWIPDFQEKFLPQFFLQHHLESRKKMQEELVRDKKPIVFSSRNAQEHFESFYPSASCKTFVLRFAVTHPPYEQIDLDGLLSKFNLKKNYFFCPNQVWAHKNHKVVIEALDILKQTKGQDIQVVFSGREMDARSPDLIVQLKNSVREKGLEDNIRFLGFIDRAEQLKLMSAAKAVIQPSLFEGWSTVVEDAKAIGQFVILSDLPVHREQLSSNVSFFDPNNPSELARILEALSLSPPEKIPCNYKKDVSAFGLRFLEIVKDVKGLK